MSDICVIINKHARRVRKDKQGLIELLHKQKGDIDIELVSSRKFTHTLRTKALANPKRIIVAGGDGTVATAAHMLAKTNIEFGIIPAGTTNSFARSLQLPLDWSQAIEAALKKTAKPVNLGVVNGQSFVSIAAIGLSEKVASTIPDSLKKRLGRLAYFIWGSIVLFRAKPFHAVIKSGKKTYVIDTFQIVVANAELHGSLPVARSANLKNDKLVLLAFGQSGSKWQHLHNLYLYARRRHHNKSDVLILEGEDFSIQTKPVKKVEVDGEVKTKTLADFSIDKKALKIAH